MAAGRGLTRPEISVLFSYCKIWLYDHVIASEVLEHISDDEQALELAAVGTVPALGVVERQNADDTGDSEQPPAQVGFAARRSSTRTRPRTGSEPCRATGSSAAWTRRSPCWGWRWRRG